MNVFLLLVLSLWLYMSGWFLVAVWFKRNDVADLAWGLGIIALGSGYGWVGLLGPITIIFLILKVSGIPLLNAKMKNKSDFEEYSKKTNVFIPWWPKEI
ncbi:MAG: DUF1295 domain-containing protein [Patescibacteria group bacterium]